MTLDCGRLNVRMTLEDDFEVECNQAIADARARGYDPTAWVAMIRRHRAAEAARLLLVSGDIQTGFERLVQMGRPDLTVEWAVLQPRWTALFSDGHRDAARWRLQQAGVELPS